MTELKYITEKHHPRYESEGAAGIDLLCDLEEPIVIKPKETAKLTTNLKVEIPKGHFGAIYPRSSTGYKKNLMLLNTVGIIDCDYRGVIGIAFYNYGDEEIVVNDGDRLVQMIIQPYAKVNIKESKELSETIRGEGGFGSTGN